MTPMTTPRRHRQIMDALAAANETRLARARLKDKIRAGKKSVRVVVLDPPWYVENMYLLDLLTAMHRYGQRRALRVMHEADVQPTKTVGDLTKRQRRVIAEVLA